MNDREALADVISGYGDWITQFYSGSFDEDDPYSACADAILARWRLVPVEQDHEHQWVDVRDLVTGADFCSVCSVWRD